jgi:hypothetical protein
MVLFCLFLKKKKKSENPNTVEVAFWKNLGKRTRRRKIKTRMNVFGLFFFRFEYAAVWMDVILFFLWRIRGLGGLLFRKMGLVVWIVVAP